MAQHSSRMLFSFMINRSISIQPISLSLSLSLSLTLIFLSWYPSLSIEGESWYAIQLRSYSHSSLSHSFIHLMFPRCCLLYCSISRSLSLSLSRSWRWSFTKEVLSWFPSFIFILQMSSHSSPLEGDACLIDYDLSLYICMYHSIAFHHPRPSLIIGGWIKENIIRDTYPSGFWSIWYNCN